MIKEGDVNIIIHNFKNEKMELVKQLAFELEKEKNNMIFLGTLSNSNKPIIVLMISKNLCDKMSLDANVIINKLASHIEGSGGGQKFLATAGGKKLSGTDKVIKEAKSLFSSILNN